MIKIFSGTANRSLAEDIIQYLDIPLGDAEISTFSDGEISVKFNENIRGADVFIIQPTLPPSDNLMELLMMLDAARRASADRITAVIPYFGYARQDRKDQPRVAISAKLVANIIATAGADRVLTMDLHNPSIQGFFDIPFDHLYGSGIFVEHLVRVISPNTVVVAPDVGSSKRARAYAKLLEVDLALVDKRRTGPNQVESVTLIGDIQDKDVLLVDDMIDTAGTLCNAASLLEERGAGSIMAVGTHALLSGPAVSRLNASPISRVLVSDTICLPEERRGGKVEILSSAHLFGEAIKRIHNAESISSLFD